jgi:hypothetical protein
MAPSSEPAELATATTTAAPNLTGHNWLALAGFVLSLSPLVVWALTIAFSSVLFPAPPSDALIGQNNSQYFTTLEVIALVSLVGSLAAVIASSLAIGRSGRYSPQQAWLGLAKAGRVLGIIGIIAPLALVLCGWLILAFGNIPFALVPCAYISTVSSNYHGG